MTKLEIFAIRDRQLDAYMQPWCAQAIGQAVRMFTDEINNKNGAMHLHPADYDLYHIGTFEQIGGHIVQQDGLPKQVAIGANVHEKT